MSDHAQPTPLERAMSRALAGRRLSRRAFLRGGLYAGAALSVPGLLAACGIGPGASPGASRLALPSAPAGALVWANWPAYIDIDEETGDYPTIQKFQQETGIQVTYSEDINDNAEFFGRIRPDLAAGNPTGYDLIVLSDWLVARVISLGYLEPLDHSKLGSFDANVDDLYRDPWYDPGNQYSLAWQSGITGIGYNPTLTGREITTFDDLLDPEFAGRTGMFSDMRDSMSLCMLSLGIDPQNATVDDARRARDKLLEAAQRNQFRNFYGNEYYDELANGNLALTVAWSGDVSQMKLYDNPDVKFVVPESGGMRWVDNMLIPKGAEHPLDAHLMMNFWYDLENAVALTEYIGYFSPVKGVPERVAADAEAAAESGDQETADILRVVAETATPSAEELERVHFYKVLGEDEEREWNELFNEVVAG